MNKFLVMFATLTLSALVHAQTVEPTDAKISPAAISSVHKLVDKADPGASHKVVNVVVTDWGMGTDVSPRYSVYLGYASMAEMGNLSANYLIDRTVYIVHGVKRLSPGIYQVDVTRAGKEEIFERALLTIDTTNMFIKEKAMRKACGNDFCDYSIDAPISVEAKIVE